MNHITIQERLYDLTHFLDFHLFIKMTEQKILFKKVPMELVKIMKII
jgi:hypothetical protein